MSDRFKRYHSNFFIQLFIEGGVKMRDYTMSMLGGLVVGILFYIVNLPLPAPPLAGIFGMLGIWLGGVVMDSIFNNSKKESNSTI